MTAASGYRRRPQKQLAAVVAAAVLLSACGAGADLGGSQASNEGFSAGLTVYSPAERSAAPDIAGTTLDGEELALSDLRGNVVVINVWGSWCGPCREEAPDLARIARQTADDGVRFVGIDTRDNLAAAKAFVRAFEIPYPSWFDEDGRLLLEFSGIIPVGAVPSTVVIDPEGRIAARVVGKITYGTLRGLVDDALAESTAKAAPLEQQREGNSS